MKPGIVVEKFHAGIKILAKLNRIVIISFQ
jgi:hypothetical protein